MTVYFSPETLGGNTSTLAAPAKYKILVIEDEEAVRDNILDLLEAEGYLSRGAENGATGLDLALKEQPDLVISDVMMPELDGYGVLAAIRQNSQTQHIPFIFLTARSERAETRLGMKLGADDYLIKPVTREELLDAISTRLAKKVAVTQHYSRELNRTAQQLDFLARHDNLTELPNRESLIARLLLSINKAPPDRKAGLIVIGLDRFQRINASLGFNTGNEVLKQVANRLKKLAAANSIFLARLQSDQFAFIVEQAEDQQALVRLTEIILSQFQSPFLIAHQELFLTASAGIAVYPDHCKEAQVMLMKADAAMHRAKQQGSNNFKIYQDIMNSTIYDPLTLESELRYALGRNELQVYYQPQIDLKSGIIIGAEALLRWHHPQMGNIPPAHFIPVAEESGMIIPIGEWVLRSVAVQNKAWQEAGLSPIVVAVNISVHQFNYAILKDKVIQILAETGLEARYLELELTEGSLMRNTEMAVRTMRSLKDLGLRISIDDFGTGYSSLSHLKQFTFDTLKIDRSFVRGISGDSENAAITQAIIQMAHSLGQLVIAEGVETEAELAFLYKNGCDAMQGYLYSPPVPAGKFAQLLSASTEQRAKLILNEAAGS